MHGVCLILSVSILLVLAGFNNAHGLTTFGKTQSSNNQQQQPPPPPARSCQKENDCSGIQNTSCVPDPRDAKLKCLCGDNTPPINGACNSHGKGPGHSCSSNTDCIHGSECTMNDSSQRGSPSKKCTCMEGFTEVDYYCNGAKQLSLTSGIIMVIFARFLY